MPLPWCLEKNKISGVLHDSAVRRQTGAENLSSFLTNSLFPVFVGHKLTLSGFQWKFNELVWQF